MGGSSGGKSTTTTQNNIPPELSGLTSKTAEGIARTQDVSGFQPEIYIAPSPRNVPGLSRNQQAASEWAGSIAGVPTGEVGAYQNLANANTYAGGSSMPWASQSGRATGGTIATDPSMAAAYNAFKGTVMPDIQRQYGLMGLGNSSLMGDAIARGAASQLYPATEAALQREQQAKEAQIARQTGAAESQIGRQTSTALNTAGQYAGLGAADTARRIAQVNALSGTGGVERQVGTEQGEADYQDMLRRQALAESFSTGILGALPSSLGSQVTSKTAGGSK